ncbi:MAG: hypothetical protein AAF960_30295, partial [Bacteroidota bacterium]
MFDQASKKRKIELIEIDAFNLLIRYVVGSISYKEIKMYLRFLGNFGLRTDKELLAYIQLKATHEAYIQSNGKSEEER